MEITINSNDLLGPLVTVAGVAEEKTTMPILGYLYFRTKNNRMTMIGTDAEVEITSHLTLPGESPDMEGTLPARKFLNFCRSYGSDKDINIAYEDGKIRLTCDKGHTVLSALPAEEFPLMTVPEGQDKKLRYSIPASELRRMMQNVVSCMPINDVRYYLNGMLFDFSPERLNMVSTDGHRMAMAGRKAEHVTEEKIKCILPREGVLQLMRLIGRQDEDVELVFYTNMVQVITKDFTFNCKLIDAAYPDYARVIPADQPNRMVSAYEPLFNSLTRCTYLMTGSNNKVQKVEFQTGKDVLRISAANASGEKMEEEIPVTYEGDSFSISFNVRYILDIVATMHEGKVEMNFTDGNSSALLRKEGDENELFVVMPMKA